MTYIPDVCTFDAQYELVSDSGEQKHAALTLYTYFCSRRNDETGICFPKLDTIVADTGIKPKSNVSMLRKFLKDVAWIEVYDEYYVRPLKGFYTDEERFKIWLKNFLFEENSVLIIRTYVLVNRSFVLIIRTLFKRILNQPIKPAQLSEGAQPAKRRRAAHTSPDKIFKNQPAGKPAPRSSASKPTNAAPAKQKPVDERRFHPAIEMVKEVTSRFPPKDIWDELIEKIGDKPDVEFFRSSYVRWRSFGGGAMNWDKWVFEPNETKEIPQRFTYGDGNGNGKPETDWQSVGKHDPERFKDADFSFEPEILNEKGKQIALQFLREVKQYGFNDYRTYESIYTPEDWAWLMENLKNDDEKQR